MVLFGLVVAQAKGASAKELGEWVEELSLLPDAIADVITTHEAEVRKIAKKYAKYDNAIYIGRDTLYPTALEGALKIKEVSYLHAEGYPAGELKHGAIALVDDRFFEVAFIAENWLYDKSLSNIIEMNARGAHVIVVTNSKKRIKAEEVVSIHTKLDMFVPLLFNVVSQLLAYYVAVGRGHDVDQPRNLAKSVTVE